MAFSDERLVREISPLDQRRLITDPSELSAPLIQRAINNLDPNSPEAVCDAEEVLDFATLGHSLHPAAMTGMR